MLKLCIVKLFVAGGFGASTIMLTGKPVLHRQGAPLTLPADRAQESLDALAEEIFELSTLSSAVRSRSKAAAAADQLTESEFLALDTLAKESPRTVGAIQKAIGVLPAQMSRIIRSLEDQGGTPYIACEINSEDRRRIDVHLSPAGRKAHEAYRRVRLGLTLEVLQGLSPGDRAEFMRLLRLMRGVIVKHISDNEL